MKWVFSNKGISISDDHFDKLWAFLDYKNEESINLTGFIDYIQQLISEAYDGTESWFRPELFKINQSVISTNILDYVKVQLDKLSAQEIFKNVYQKDEWFKYVWAEDF